MIPKTLGIALVAAAALALAPLAAAEYYEGKEDCPPDAFCTLSMPAEDDPCDADRAVSSEDDADAGYDCPAPDRRDGGHAEPSSGGEAHDAQLISAPYDGDDERVDDCEEIESCWRGAPADEGGQAWVDDCPEGHMCAFGDVDQEGNPEDAERVSESGASGDEDYVQAPEGSETGITSVDEDDGANTVPAAGAVALIGVAGVAAVALALRRP